jgi:ferredoxin
MAKRAIVEIDESKCDGCGLCVPSCAEGAIQIVGGKAKLVSDVYCDGLGACLGHCPHGAITVVQREAAPFDKTLAGGSLLGESPVACPGSAPCSLKLNVLPIASRTPDAIAQPGPTTGAEAGTSALGHWPVQLHLVPPRAPFLREADLLLVADCVPVAMPDFHARLLRGHPVVIACPKLDDTRPHIEKLARMIAEAPLRSLTVVHMEVPCCSALMRLAEAARQASGRQIPLERVVVSVRGIPVGPEPTTPR